jgi:hypothetical protein
MPVHSFEITRYDVEMVSDAEGATRGLQLEEAAGDRRNVAFLQFVPADRRSGRRQVSVSEQVVAVAADLPVAEFEWYYHLLQTEQPVFCYAAYERGEGPIHELETFGLTTDLETVGEGFADVSP